MFDTSLLISALTLATVVVSLVSALFVAMNARRTARRASTQIAEVHVMVNHNLDEVSERVDQLTALLEREGIDVPEPKELIERVLTPRDDTPKAG